MEQTNLQTKKTGPKYLALKIVSIIVYLALLTFLLIEFIPILSQTDINNKKIMIAAFLVLILIIIGGIGAIVSTLISIVGLIIAIANRKKDQTKTHVIYFIIMSILPLLTEIIFFIACKIIS